MSVLSEEQRREFRMVLENRRAELESRLRRNRTETQPVDLDLPIGRLSRMDSIQQQSMMAEQLRQNERDLQIVRAALERLDGPRFGCCLRCHEPIPYERLKARPVTTLCVSCQERLESERS